MVGTVEVEAEAEAEAEDMSIHIKLTIVPLEFLTVPRWLVIVPLGEIHQEHAVHPVIVPLSYLLQMGAVTSDLNWLAAVQVQAGAAATAAIVPDLAPPVALTTLALWLLLPILMYVSVRTEYHQLRRIALLLLDLDKPSAAPMVRFKAIQLVVVVALVMSMGVMAVRMVPVEVAAPVVLVWLQETDTVLTGFHETDTVLTGFHETDTALTGFHETDTLLTGFHETDTALTGFRETDTALTGFHER